MSLRVKLCGIADERSLGAAIAAAPDAIGFVLSASPRQVSVSTAATLAARVPPAIATVLVFRRPDLGAIAQALDSGRFDGLQCDADALRSIEPQLPATLLRLPVVRGAAHDGEAVLARYGRVLIEAPRSGCGETADWTRAASLARLGELWLAGGLTPDTVAAAIAAVGPAGVDVSSGVESAPAQKDPERCRRFVMAARGAAPHRDRVARQEPSR